MLTPLMIFVFLGLFSPGPNVILLTASGVRFGFRPTLPHVAGVAIGVGVTSGLMGFGLGAVLQTWPALELALQIIAASWIFFMAYRLWTTSGAGRVDGPDRPFTFLEAVLFQWVNPKVWAVAAAATAYATATTPLGTAQQLALAFSGINLGVCLFWTCAGSLLSYLLSTPTAYRIFMRGMALLLAGSAVMVFL